MNYLAHLFLTPEPNALQVGNFIADSVRGSQILQFPEEVRAGIVLHRQIDAFTDQHEVVRQTKERLRPEYGKFAGVIADMFYDHFLAKNFSLYSETALPDFSERFYQFIQPQLPALPPKVQFFLPYMIAQNWLLNYGLISGIDKSLQGLSRRSKFGAGMVTAAAELERNYPFYQTEFEAFFPELQKFVLAEIKVI